MEHGGTRDRELQGTLTFMRQGGKETGRYRRHRSVHDKEAWETGR